MQAMRLLSFLGVLLAACLSSPSAAYADPPNHALIPTPPSKVEDARRWWYVGTGTGLIVGAIATAHAGTWLSLVGWCRGSDGKCGDERDKGIPTLAGAGVALGVGIALIVIGVKKKRDPITSAAPLTVRF